MMERTTIQKRKRRFLAAALSLAMLIGMLPLQAIAAVVQDKLDLNDEMSSEVAWLSPEATIVNIPDPGSDGSYYVIVDESNYDVEDYELEYKSFTGDSFSIADKDSDQETDHPLTGTPRRYTGVCNRL